MTSEIRQIWRPVERLKENDIEQLARADLKSIFDSWEDVKDELTGTGKLGQFTKRLYNLWSIETGMIEGLYSIRKGATITLIEQGFKADLIRRNDTTINREKLIAILNDHRDGIDFILDIIGGTREFTPDAIKDLHGLVTRHQETALGRDALGELVQIPLIHGDYKKQPNNPTDVSGTKHIYCPPEQVSSEMEKLFRFYYETADRFPEVVGAWLHHRFAQIHPFQDGNGRVGRYLFNFVFIKQKYLPTVITRKHKIRYIKAMESADVGDFNSLRRLVNLIADIQKDTLISAINLAEDELTVS